MTKPTTEELKELLAKVTPGEWYIGGGQVTSDTLHEMDCITDHVYGPDRNATLIALAPTLAAEVVELRCTLGLIADLCDDPVMRNAARQALSQK